MADPLVGTLFDDKFQITAFIGEGATGKVYRATHLMLQRDVALKLLHEELCTDSTFRSKFKREFVTGASLEHECISKIYSASESSGGKLYLVMDLIDGVPLAQLLQEGPLPLERFYGIFDDVLSALEYAHAKGVVHRDIKPANIMIVGGDRQRGVLVDFGIAKLITGEPSNQKLTATGTIQGTSAYMSPEQCTGGSVDARSDIYSLGCSMYEALTCEPPFSGSTEYDIMYKHVNDSVSKLKSLDKLSKSISRIITRCLKKDPALRYSNIAELKADLNAAKFECSSTASAKPARQKQSLLYGGISAILVLLSTFMLFSFVSPRSKTASLLPLSTTSDAASREHRILPLGSKNILKDCTDLTLRREYRQMLNLADAWFQRNQIANPEEMAKVSYQRAFALQNLGETQEAIKTFQDIVQNEAATPNTRMDALNRLADIDLETEAKLPTLQARMKALETLDHRFENQLSTALRRDCKKQLVRLSTKSKDKKEFLRLATAAIDYSEQMNLETCDLRLLLANFYKDEGKPADCTRVLRKALSSIKSPPGAAADYCSQISGLAAKIKDNVLAEDAFTRELELWSQTAVNPLRDGAYDRYGDFLLSINQFDKARKVFEQKGKIPALRTERISREALVQSQLARCSALSGNLVQGRKEFEALLRWLYGQRELRHAEINFFSLAVDSYVEFMMRQELSSEARNFLQQLAHSQVDALDAPILRAAVYNALAATCNTQPEMRYQFLSRALKEYLSVSTDGTNGERALVVVRQMEAATPLAERYERSIKAYEQVGKWCQDNSFVNSYVNSTICRALLEQQSGHKEEYYRLVAALTSVPSISRAKSTECFIRLGDYYKDANQFEKSKEAYDKAISSGQKLRGAERAEQLTQALLGRALLAGRMNQNELKASLLQQSLLEGLRGHNKIVIGAVRANMAIDYRDRGDKKSSLQAMNEAINLAQEGGTPAALADLQVIRSRWLHEDKGLQQAKYALENALNTLPPPSELDAVSGLARARLQHQLAVFNALTRDFSKSQQLFEAGMDFMDDFNKVEAATKRLEYSEVLLNRNFNLPLANKLIGECIPVLRQNGVQCAEHLIRAEQIQEQIAKRL